MLSNAAASDAEDARAMFTIPLARSPHDAELSYTFVGITPLPPGQKNETDSTEKHIEGSEQVTPLVAP